MSCERLRITWKVAWWEFNRFFKLKDMAKGLLYMILGGAVGGTVTVWLARGSFTVPNVAVADYGVFEPQRLQRDEIRFINHAGTPFESLLEMLDRGEIDAVLSMRSADEAEIRMPSDRSWVAVLEQLINELRTEHQLKVHGIDEDVFSSIRAGIDLTRVFQAGSKATVADKAVAGGAIALVLMAVFLGLAYQFTAITAEKQQRITEQVVSAISPQVWIDGKIIGITGIGLIYVVFYGGMSIVGTAVLATFGVPVGSALGLLSPLLVMTFLTLALLGVLMWNSFLAGVAATIDDPNSSQRAAWIFLPLLPVLFAFFTLVNPDTLPIRVLGMLPLTSYAVLPARMVLTQVPWWEPVVALVLLAGAAWLFRLVTGRIFSVGMMMYGKEPTLKEMAHWFRRAR